jgi:hypothetical protein
VLGDDISLRQARYLDSKPAEFGALDGAPGSR